MKALILAAGQGTRLKQLTASRPKPMLPIGGRPVLEHVMQWLRHYGITEIAVNLHYRHDVIVEHFGSGGHLGVAITYSYEDQLMGTAGAAKQLVNFLDETFVVTYGDVLTNLDLYRLGKMHHQHQGDKTIATLALYSVPNPTECGLAEVNRSGRVNSFVEKPKAEDVTTDLAFSGVMLCEPTILDFIANDKESDFGFDVFPQLLRAGTPVYGQRISDGEYVVDIGTLPGYLHALELKAVESQRLHARAL